MNGRHDGIGGTPAAGQALAPPEPYARAGGRPLLMAGFECGRLEWQGHRCLLTADRHLPGDRMAAHYAVARGLGITLARDGLPPWLPFAPRLRVAREAGFHVVWDLDHYWRHEEPTAYALRVVSAVRREHPAGEPFRVCFNELALVPTMCPGLDHAEAVRRARLILTVLREELPDVSLWTAEPAHVPGEMEAHAWAEEQADVIGLNFYPQWLAWPVEDVLRCAAERYPGKPIVIAETGLHAGYGGRWDHPGLYSPAMTKAEWLGRVVDGVARSGVPVAVVCLYPFVNGTAWHGDGSGRYDNGLVREDLSVDPDLAAAVRAWTDAPSEEAA